MTWFKAAMVSDRLAIPRLCPSCMKPGSQEWRYAYSSGNQRSWGTFFYCDPCSERFRRTGNTWRIVAYTSILLWIPGALALAYTLGLSGAPIIALALAVPIVFSAGIALLRRRALPADVVARGFTAYYTGTQRTGIGMRMRDESTFMA